MRCFTSIAGESDESATAPAAFGFKISKESFLNLLGIYEINCLVTGPAVGLVAPQHNFRVRHFIPGNKFAPIDPDFPFVIPSVRAAHLFINAVDLPATHADYLRQLRGRIFHVDQGAEAQPLAAIQSAAANYFLRGGCFVYCHYSCATSQR